MTPDSPVIELERSHDLTVKVVIADGRPAAGLTVRVNSDGGLEWDGPPTDALGVSVLKGLAAETHSIQTIGTLPGNLGELPSAAFSFQPLPRRRGMAVRGFDPSKESLWTATEDVPRSAIVDGGVLLLQLAPLPLPRVSGTVVGGDSDWRQPHEVFVYRRGWRVEKFRGIPKTAGTFAVDPATGEFQGALLPGSYVAVATAGRPNAGTSRKDLPQAILQVRRSNAVQFEVAAEDVKLLLDFSAAPSLEGSVKLPDGTPLPGLDVLLEKQESIFISTVATATTEGSGKFRFVGLGAGTYILRVRARRLASTAVHTVTIDDGSTGKRADLVVRRAGALRFEVVDAEGQPIPNATPSLQLPGSTVRFPPIIKSDDPAWEGAYGPLVPGTYAATWLEHLENGVVRFHREPVTVEAGEVADVRVQVATEAASINQGQVLSGDGPAAGVAVWLSDDMGVAASGRTDTNGHFTLESMSSGRMTHFVGTSLIAPVSKRPVELLTGRGTAPVITLPTGSIELTFASGSGATIFDIPALDRVGSPRSGGHYRRSDSSIRGVHTIRYLPDGRYELYVLGSGGERHRDWQTQIIEVRDGEQVRGVEIQRRR